MVLMLVAGILALTVRGGGHAAAVPYPCGLAPCRAAFTKVPTRGFEGAYVTADPKDPQHVIVVDTDLLAAKCGWHTTYDGGKTWIDGVFELPAGYTSCRINPPSGGHVPSGSVAFGLYGKVYAVFGSASAANQGRESVLMVSSLDGGTTFLPAKVAVAPQPGYGLARPLMIVARGASGTDELLLSFWGCHQISAGTQCDEALFSKSDDGGDNFSPGVLVNKPPGGQNPSQPAIGPNGALYMTFQRRYTDHVDLFLATSRDAGITWNESKIDTENQIGLQYDPAKLVVDPKSGALYTVWADTRTGSPQIFFRKSTDKGMTWSNAALLTPDSTGVNGGSRDPSIDIAPNGRIDVAYYYTAPEMPTDDEVYLDSSIDGGVTFSVRQVNPKPINRTLGYSGSINSLGEVGNQYPPEVASLNGAAYVVWSDTANATKVTETQDVDMRELLFSGTTPKA
ncbi:MAG: sialidase family protein [Acidimicrobiales bacterium]